MISKTIMLNRKNYNANIYFVGLILIMFVMENFFRQFFIKELTLTYNAFPKIWQFFTYAFYTGLDITKAGFSQLNILWFIFHVLIAFWFGRMLEAYLGTYRYIIFLVLTLLGESLVVYAYRDYILITGGTYSRGIFDLAIMMMFGLTFPREEIYVFFIIRVRVLILAIIYYLWYLFGVFQIWNRSFFEIVVILSIFLGSSLGIIVFKIAGNVLKGVKTGTNKLVNNIKEKKNITRSEEEYDLFLRIKQKLEYGKILSSRERKYLESLKKTEPEGNLCMEEDFEPETELCKNCANYGLCIKRFLDNHIIK